MQLNHILLFTAVASSFLVFLRTQNAAGQSWIRTAAALVLLLSAFAWIFFRSAAGIIAAIAWLALLLVPAVARNRQARRSGFHPQQRLNLSPAVSVLVALNLLVFIAELLMGGSTNPLTLHRLGELDTDLVRYAHEYWRLGTALFLHYGILHLLFNLMALVVLGPPLEREIGTLSFTVCYLLSGLGSSLAVLLLTIWGVTESLQLVGASGCIMGVVGAWAGFLLRHRHAPLARQRLSNIGVIVGLQFVFDLVTPEISMSAHLGGLVTGFLLGLILSAKNGRGM